LAEVKLVSFTVVQPWDAGNEWTRAESLAFRRNEAAAPVPDVREIRV
jgi:hypothetical protein